MPTICFENGKVRFYLLLKSNWVPNMSEQLLGFINQQSLKTTTKESKSEMIRNLLKLKKSYNYQKMTNLGVLMLHPVKWKSILQIGTQNRRKFKDPMSQDMDWNRLLRQKFECLMRLQSIQKRVKCSGRMQDWTRLNLFTWITWGESFWRNRICSILLIWRFMIDTCFILIGCYILLFELTS